MEKSFRLKRAAQPRSWDNSSERVPKMLLLTAKALNVEPRMAAMAPRASCDAASAGGWLCMHPSN